VLLVLIFAQSSAWRSFLIGWGFGTGHFFAGLYWIGNSFFLQDDVIGWVGYPMTLSLAAMLAIYVGLVAMVLKIIHRHHDLRSHILPMIISFTILWSLAEWLRGYLFTGFPWNLTGYVWGFSDVMLQNTSLWGIQGLGIFTAFAVFVPFMVWIKGWKNIQSLSVVCVTLAFLAAMLAFGIGRLQNPTTFVPDVKLQLVQANINQQDKWDRNLRADNFLNYLNMSRYRNAKKIEAGDVTHIIWPETAVIYYLDQEPSRRFLIADMLDDGAYLLTGFPRVDRSGPLRVFNSFAAIDHTGEVRGIYDKSHLVPFGEYIPAFFKQVLEILGFTDAMGGLDYTSGDGVKTLNLPGLPPVGLMICYEVIFPGQVIDPKNRPGWLLNVTNDAWYGNSSGPRQHYLQTRVRAIEEGLPMVRSAGTGISAIIDAYGRVTAQAGLNKRTVITGGLPVSLEEPTVYSRYSLWTFGASLIILVLLNSLLLQRHVRGSE